MDSEKLEYLRKCMKEVLSDSRYRHVIGVEEVCHDLALIYGVDVESACIAGILHDCAKYMTGDDMIRECVEHGIEISKIERKLPHMLLHSKVGAVYAREKYGINDEDILNAIEFHTTGRPGMSKLERILFVADYIEPNRKDSIPRLNEIRETVYRDLDEGFIKILENKLAYLNQNEYLIDPRTEETYKYYVNE